MTYCWLAKFGYPGYPLNNWWISQWISECLNSKSLAKFVGRRMWKDHCIGLKFWRYWTPYDQSNGSNQCFFPAQISLFNEFTVQVSTVWTVWRGFWDVNFELNLQMEVQQNWQKFKTPCLFCFRFWLIQAAGEVDVYLRRWWTQHA